MERPLRANMDKWEIRIVVYGFELSNVKNLLIDGECVE